MNRNQINQSKNKEILAMVPMEEVEKRAWNAADKFVKILEDFSGEPNNNIMALRDYFASRCVSLLLQRFIMPVPEQ